MHVPRVVTLGVAVVAVGLGAWAFYTTVLATERDGQTLEDVAATGYSTQQASSSVDEAAIASGDTAGVVPPLMGGLRITGLQSGDLALASVERLHGKALGAGLDAAWVAEYGNPGEATLWVSRSADPADARVLFERMTAKIAEGNSPFTGLTPMADPALEGYELDGMGQKHYYFVAGTDLYWMAARPDLAEAALADLTESALSTPAEVN